MKIFILTLFLCFFLFSASAIHAGNTTLTSNYPATNGSYTKITINPGSSGATLTCTSAADIGQLFYDTVTKTLQICAKVNGAVKPIPANETCFNRFWNGIAGTALPNGCPAGYSAATTIGLPENFQTQIAPAIYVNSTVCCTTGSVVVAQ